MSSEKRIEILKSYILKDPKDFFSKYALSLEFIAGNRDEEAIVLLKEIIQANPQYLPAYYQLGKLMEKYNNAEEAIIVYEQGMEVAREQYDTKTYNELSQAVDGIRMNEE
ncbi:MAG TPA: tetratricopeptide repeat protein [Bacteroidia bacterium]|nr:tetratricopeptide repeat protein [Bacteroidia bacterium]HNT79833.1 tetratricopeptide repeat protein [Bacteroidia bacterium]